MAHQIPWDTSFNNLPVGTNKVKDTPVYIRQARQGVAERIKQEHNMELSDYTTNNQGKHNEGSARCFVQDLAPSNPSVTKATVYVEGETPDFKQGRQYFNPLTRGLFVYVAGEVNSFLEHLPSRLANIRKIGGVDFDGTADIDLPGVNVAGTQNTSGRANTALLATNATNAYACSGNAATATLAVRATDASNSDSLEGLDRSIAKYNLSLTAPSMVSLGNAIRSASEPSNTYHCSGCIAIDDFPADYTVVLSHFSVSATDVVTLYGVTLGGALKTIEVATYGGDTRSILAVSMAW